MLIKFQVAFGPTPPEIKAKRSSGKVSADVGASAGKDRPKNGKQPTSAIMVIDTDESDEDANEDPVEFIVRKVMLVDPLVKPLKRGGLPCMSGERVPKKVMCRKCQKEGVRCVFGAAAACVNCSGLKSGCGLVEFVGAVLDKVKVLRNALNPPAKPPAKKGRKKASQSAEPENVGDAPVEEKSSGPSAGSSKQASIVSSEPLSTTKNSGKRKASVSEELPSTSKKRVAKTSEEPEADSSSGRKDVIRPPRRKNPSMMASNSSEFVSAAEKITTRSMGAVPMARSTSAPVPTSAGSAMEDIRPTGPKLTGDISSKVSATVGACNC